MTVSDWLDEAEARASHYGAARFAHEGDCAGTLCAECGHCQHSIASCEHECAPGDGCANALEDDEVITKRLMLAMIATIRSIEQVKQTWSIPPDYRMDSGWGVAVLNQATSHLDPGLIPASEDGRGPRQAVEARR